MRPEYGRAGVALSRYVIKSSATIAARVKLLRVSLADSFKPREKLMEFSKHDLQTVQRALQMAHSKNG